MDRRGFLQGLFGVTAAAGALSLGVREVSAAIISPAPLNAPAEPAAPAAVLNESELETVKPEQARWVWVRRRRYRRYRVIRRRRYLRRRRRFYYVY